MKKIAQRVQNLSQKAAELRRVAEGVPPKVQELREALIATAGQVQKARADIFTSVSALRASDDEQLVQTLREIDASSTLLEEAGFRLSGVDMDMGGNRRLIVQLERIDDVAPDDLQALLKANAQRPVQRALLEALLRADELASKVQLKTLRYTQMFVDVGPMPSVRVGWRAEEPRSTFPSTLPLATATAPIATTTPAATPFVAAGASSFFERRTPFTTTTAAPASAAALASEDMGLPPQTVNPVVATAHAVPPEPIAAPEAPRSAALDRFKKMPDLSKRPVKIGR